jgi:hypothetical protein
MDLVWTWVHQMDLGPDLGPDLVGPDPDLSRTG